MQKILMYRGKHDHIFWDVSTEELKKKALLDLFRFMDEEQYYYDLLEIHQLSMYKPNPFDDSSENQAALYRLAKEGNVRACEALLNIRIRAEYEGWDIYPVQEGGINED